MSKKTLLEESTVRKFMRLANLEPLSDSFIKEELGYTEEEDMGMGSDEEEMAPVDDMGDMDDMGGEEGDLEIDLDDAGAGGEVSPEVARKVLQAVMGALGVEGTVEDDEDMGGADDMGDMDDFGGDEEEAGEEEEEAGEEDFGGEEDEGEEELDEEYESKEKEENSMEEATLSEDDLVENVLRRVTTRLVSEAKAAKAKKSVKEKMKAKKGEKLDEENHVKTHKKSNPLLTKGKNKHSVYKGIPDQKMGKGENGGSGDHEMKPLKGSKNHIVTNKKDLNKLSSKGKNKS